MQQKPMAAKILMQKYACKLLALDAEATADGWVLRGSFGRGNSGASDGVALRPLAGPAGAVGPVGGAPPWSEPAGGGAGAGARAGQPEPPASPTEAWQLEPVALVATGPSADKILSTA